MCLCCWGLNLHDARGTVVVSQGGAMQWAGQCGGACGGARLFSKLLFMRLLLGFFRCLDCCRVLCGHGVGTRSLRLRRLSDAALGSVKSKTIHEHYTQNVSF